MYKFKPPMNDIKFTEKDDDVYLASTTTRTTTNKMLTRVVHI